MGESSFRHCYGNLFESVILKVIWSQLYSFSTIARYIDNSVLKDTLKLKILRKWIKIRATSFIKTWVNIKWKSTKVPWKLSLAEKYDPALQRTLHQSRWYFAYCYMLLFLSVTVYLHSYLLIADIWIFDIWVWVSSSGSTPFLKKTVKFWWGSIFFF